MSGGNAYSEMSRAPFASPLSEYPHFSFPDCSVSARKCLKPSRVINGLTSEGSRGIPRAFSIHYQTIQTHDLRDFLIAIEHTGRYHPPTQEPPQPTERTMPTQSRIMKKRFTGSLQ
jgi:hypothetical protein